MMTSVRPGMMTRTGAVRFGNDPQVLKALQKIADNTQNYSIRVALGQPDRSHTTIHATNKQGGQKVKIVSHFLGRDVSIEAGGQTYTTTENAAYQICRKLEQQFGPNSGGSGPSGDIDI